MLVTTIQHKSHDFDTLEEYIDFRIRDCGAFVKPVDIQNVRLDLSLADTSARFGEGVMLFGMGLVLSVQERGGRRLDHLSLLRCPRLDQ